MMDSLVEAADFVQMMDIRKGDTISAPEEIAFIQNGSVITVDWYFQNEDWINNVTFGNYQKYHVDV